MSKAEAIKRLLSEGKNYPTIVRETGAATSTIAYHAKRMGVGKFSFDKKIYDWTAIQVYYDQGFCISEVVEHFGMNWKTLVEARARGDVQMNVRNRTRKIKNDIRGSYSDAFIFRQESTLSSNTVKKRAKELLPYYCAMEDCDLYMKEAIWAGKSIVLQLDHINGVRNDNRIENLRWLCPNCHSQTDTYCGRNNIRK